MLRQLLRRLCRVDAVSLLGCRPSVIQRHFLRSCSSSSSHRSVTSDSPAAAVAKDPRWVMLNLCGRSMDDSFVADAKTVADSRTRFTGLNLRVSLAGAAPPASSFLYYDLTDSGVPDEDVDVDVDEDNDDDDDDYISVDVVAAHTDSILLRMANRRCSSAIIKESDYFLYRAGAAGPPSLSLLPDRNFLTKTESLIASCRVRPPVCPSLDNGSTGLLRRGKNEKEDDLLVVQVEPWYDRHTQRQMLEFCVLRTGTDMRQYWELMEPVPILVDDDDTVVPHSFSGDAVVVPVGDRYLCCFDYEKGVVLCDMADDASPKVRCVPLPTEVSGRCRYDDEWDDNVFPLKYSMRMGAAGDSKVRLVSIDPHCCCGGHGRSTCPRSRFAFTVTTWTMDLGMDLQSPLRWVKDGEINAEEVWSLPGYEGLPRANLQCPVVSLDDPNVVCFLVTNRHFVDTFEDRKIWMIQLNIKTKTLLSVAQFTGDPWSAFDHLPAQLQY